MQWRVNNYGRLLELSDYDVGGWRSFIIIPEGRDGVIMVMDVLVEKGNG